MSFILYLLQASVCLTIFYGFYVVALHRHTDFTLNRLYLILTILISMIIPLIEIPVQQDEAIFTLPASNLFIATVSPDANHIGEANTTHWKDVVFIAYILIAAILLGRLLSEVFRVWAIADKGDRQVIQGHSYIASSRTQMPFSFFNLMVLPSMIEYDDQEMSNIIKHESAHIRGGHSWDIMLIEMLGVLFWFNPIVYSYKKRIREVHEYIADAAVVRHTSWDAYASFLLQQKSNGIQLSVSNLLLQTQLEKRLLMLTKRSTTIIARLKYLGIVPLVFVSTILVSCERLSNLSEADVVGNAANSDTLPATVITAYHEPDTLPKEFLSEPYTYVEEMPRFPGCEDLPKEVRSECWMQKMNTYLYSNLKYPSEDRSKRLQGTVIAQFTIEKNGSVSDIKIIRSVSPGLDGEAMRIIESMNNMPEKWIPGYHLGVPVNVRFTLPFKFKLEAEKSNKTFSTETKKEEPFTYVEEMPRYPGCEDLDKSKRSECANQKMYEFIFTNIKYPAEDRKNANEGTVIAQFTIEKDGSISDIDVLRSVSPGLDAEAVRIIESMPNWIPGYHNGHPVRVRFTLPFKFQLQSKAE